MKFANENAKGAAERPFLRLDTGRGGADERTPASSPIGALLCVTRMRMGKDLQYVAEVLHIRYNFLVAIEDGRYEDLPGQAYAIGFVRAYADHLGLDGDEIVRRYKEESVSVKRRSVFEFPLPTPDSGVPSGLLILLAIVIGMLIYGVWYTLAGSDRSAVQVIQEVPDRLLAVVRGTTPPPVAREGDYGAEGDPSASGTEEAAPETLTTSAADESISAPAETGAATTEPKPPEAVVELRAKSDIWITLRDSQKLDHTQFLRKDEVFKVVNAAETTLLTGSGKELEILLDGKATPIPEEGAFARGVALDPNRLRGGIPAANPPP